MIVQCDQCQTKFKIPDAKVTDKGVKVRCTKCQHTFRVARPAEENPFPAPAVAAPAPGGDDPFAQFGPPPTHAPEQESLETRPGFFALGVAATRPVGQQPSPQVLNPWGDTVESAADLLNQPTAVARFTSTRPPPPPTSEPDWFGAPAAATAPTAPPADPLMDWGLSPPPAAAASPAAPPPPAAGEGLGMGLFDDVAPPTSPAKSSLPPPSASSAVFSEDLSMDLGGGGDGGMDGGPSFQADHQFFDMPAPEPERPLAPSSSSGLGDSLLGDIPDVDAVSQAPTVPATPLLSPAPLSPPKVVKPTGRQDNMGLKERKPTTLGGRLLAIAVNLLVAAVLVLAVAAVGNVWMNGGRLDASIFSPAGLKAVFTANRGMVARDVTEGLYETRSGSPVFFVRGDVENRSHTAGKVKVRAELWDGAQLMGSAETLAGEAPSPEDLYGITGPQDVDSLNAKLTGAAKVVAPGMRVPFMLTFGKYPPELTGLKLKVVATAVQ